MQTLGYVVELNLLISCFAVNILWWKQEIAPSSASWDMDAFKLMKELRVNYEQEVDYLPKETGLSLIESTSQVRTFDTKYMLRMDH